MEGEGARYSANHLMVSMNPAVADAQELLEINLEDRLGLSLDYLL
jgi:hypothetical protein